MINTHVHLSLNPNGRQVGDLEQRRVADQDIGEGRDQACHLLVCRLRTLLCMRADEAGMLRDRLGECFAMEPAGSGPDRARNRTSDPSCHILQIDNNRAARFGADRLKSLLVE